MAFVNNMFQMRTDGTNICVRIDAYNRMASKISVPTSRFFELMNYTGVMSSFLSIIYRTNVIPVLARALGRLDEHAPTKHQLDCVFMVCCGSSRAWS